MRSRFSKLFEALTARGLQPEPAVYHDDFADEVRRQLMALDGVLVWRNPIEDGRDRSVLDALLRDVAAAGVFVSAHPDVILKLGTKEVLYRTRDLGWGCDTYPYRTMDDLRRELPSRLRDGSARVLKQYRGSGGDGVWKVELASDVGGERGNANANSLLSQTVVRVRHAKRGCVEEKMPLSEFLEQCRPYLEGHGRMIDQAYQSRLPEGMIRCYLVHDKVAGFGHQAINALYPAPAGAPPDAAPPPGPRLYHPPHDAGVPVAQAPARTGMGPGSAAPAGNRYHDLPVLWDCDFLLGPKNDSGEDTYVLCEINVSSVAPFPDSALNPIAEATFARIQQARAR